MGKTGVPKKRLSIETKFFVPVPISFLLFISAWGQSIRSVQTQRKGSTSAVAVEAALGVE